MGVLARLELMKMMLFGCRMLAGCKTKTDKILPVSNRSEGTVTCRKAER